MRLAIVAAVGVLASAAVLAQTAPPGPVPVVTRAPAAPTPVMRVAPIRPDVSAACVGGTVVVTLPRPVVDKCVEGTRVLPLPQTPAPDTPWTPRYVDPPPLRLRLGPLDLRTTPLPQLRPEEPAPRIEIWLTPRHE